MPCEPWRQASDRPEPRIRWEPTKYGGWTGHVGTMEPWAFQIWQVDGPDSPWRLDSALLSQFGYHIDHPDPAPLKAHAERWLAGFVSSLGAVFEPVTPEPDCSAVTRFEVIDHSTGKSEHLITYQPGEVRSVIAYGVAVKAALQDDGWTLKVFLADPADREDCPRGATSRRRRSRLHRRARQRRSGDRPHPRPRRG